MHPNPAFRAAGADRNLAFARSQGFGTLAINGENGPLLSHVPFLLSDDGACADLHLVRSNPMVPVLGGSAVLSVTGPEGYVSPDWYGIPDQVPTWNYVAVHLRGRLDRLPDAALRGILDEVSDHFEARLLPKPVWKTAKMSPGVMEKMMRALVPCRLHIETVDGTWKLNQNKPDAVRHAAATAMADHGIGTDVQALSALMRDPPGP